MAVTTTNWGHLVKVLKHDLVKIQKTGVASGVIIWLTELEAEAEEQTNNNVTSHDLRVLHFFLRLPQSTFH